ncbi:MAG: hypothetical protein ACXWNI_06945 [Candidatus Limnocylindrales bacterium]
MRSVGVSRLREPGDDDGKRDVRLHEERGEAVAQAVGAGVARPAGLMPPLGQ